MATIAELRKLDDENATSILQEFCETLNRTLGEVVIDFSLVRRLDTSTLRSLEEFAIKAEADSVKVVLRGVNVDVYKVLALVELTSRFSFVN